MLQALMQHLESHDGYYHFATKIYCQILHEFGNKRRWNRNQATNSGTWSLHPIIEPNAGRAIRQNPNIDSGLMVTRRQHPNFVKSDYYTHCWDIPPQLGKRYSKNDMHQHRNHYI